MSASEIRPTTEGESRQVAEESRETEWAGRAIIREMFLGNFPLPLMHPFPLDADKDRPEFAEFYEKLKNFMKTEVDSVAIDQTGEYPDHVVDGLRQMGAFAKVKDGLERYIDPDEADRTGEYPPEGLKALAEIGIFGMKIPKEYGGLGFTVREYTKVMEMVGCTDGNITALLSAHQSIGIPQPIKLFGTEEQKQKYLTRCAKGAISAFALTEPHAGSDPASLSTTAVRDGDYFVLNGEKLWCTNGTLAELLVVMARNPETKKISAFVVETDSPGVKVEHRCRFMGLKALGNGVISFNNVKVPAENLIGKEGQGLKIALITLNTGRLTLPAACAGIGKQSLEIIRTWCNDRSQWGVPIGKHEAMAHKIADIAATTFAMDSVSKLSRELRHREN